MRSFQEKEEKSAVSPQLIMVPEYADTLSLTNLNKYVYYSVSALDQYYNESAPCAQIKVEKPNLSPPGEPVITSFNQDGNKITLNWVANDKDSTSRYDVFRSSNHETIGTTVLRGDNKARMFIDELDISGTYKYKVIAVAANGKSTDSFHQPSFDVSVKEDVETVSGFRYYKNENENYIELSWRKHPKAVAYSLYKKEDNKPMVLLKELDVAENKFMDENISPSVNYTYMILYVTESGIKSKPKILNVL